MTPELVVLIFGVFLQAGQLALFARHASSEYGPDYAISPRDTPPPGRLSERGGRLQRAMNNQFEALILFAPAALVVALTGQSNWWTGVLAWVWLLARIGYVPAYAMGLSPGRSIVWTVGFTANMLLALAALL